MRFDPRRDDGVPFAQYKYSRQIYGGGDSGRTIQAAGFTACSAKVVLLLRIFIFARHTKDRQRTIRKHILR